MSHSEDLPEPPQHAAPSRFAAATNTLQQQEAWDQLKQVLGHPQAPGTPTLKEPASGPTEAACTAFTAAAVKAAVKTAVSEHVEKLTALTDQRDALEDQLRTARAAPPTAASPAAAEDPLFAEVRRLQEKITDLETKLGGDLGKTCSSLVAEGIDKAKVEWEKTVLPERIKEATDPLQATIKELEGEVKAGDTDPVTQFIEKLKGNTFSLEYIKSHGGISEDGTQIWCSPMGINVKNFDMPVLEKFIKHLESSKTVPKDKDARRAMLLKLLMSDTVADKDSAAAAIINGWKPAAKPQKPDVVEDSDTEDVTAAEAWNAKKPEDILGNYNGTQEAKRRQLTRGKYFRTPGDTKAYEVEVEVDGDKTRTEVVFGTLVASGFSTMDKVMKANPTFYFEILDGESRVELRFGTTNTDPDPTGTLQGMFGDEVYTEEKNEASKKLGETILHFQATTDLPTDVEEAMGAIILLIDKGDMFDELEDRGLIVDSKYVGGFFEKGGTGDHEIEIRRVNEAFKLLHVVMKCTVGMVTSKGLIVDTQLDEVEAGVNNALTVSKFPLKRLAPGVEILEEVGKKIKYIKELSLRDSESSQTMSALLTAGDLLSQQSDKVLFMISSGISSFLFTATGDAEAPFASIAKIAFQFLKARDFVKSVIAKTMGEGTTDISTDVNTDTLHYFGAGDANQIIARMLMAYS